jgi:hypothetical protein
MFKFIWRSYKCSMYKLFVTRQIPIRSLILSKQTWAYFRHHLQQLLWCQGHCHGADVTKEYLETNFYLSSTLLCKLCVNNANGFNNVGSVYFFYSNPVFISSLLLSLIGYRVQNLFHLFPFPIITLHFVGV